MNLTDILNNVNTYIGDASTDRLSSVERYLAATEATAWLLEELGNEHMVDRAEIEYLPSVTWYKMDSLTPYLLTAGQLRYKEEDDQGGDFTRIDARDLTTMNKNREAYAIEQFDGSSYLGITIPSSSKNPQSNLIAMDKNDGLTYTGVNATSIVGEKNAIRWDMTATGPTSSGLSTVSDSISISSFEDTGVFIFEVEIPDITDVTSISLKFGDNLVTDYYLGTVTQDVNDNPLVEGVNTIKIKWEDLTLVGAPDLDAVVAWSILVNHDTGKAAVDGWRFSDLRIANPVYLNFKYVFYRVGKDASDADLIEFSAGTDVPFFIDRYPQYRFAVAHKTAAILFRGLRLSDEARGEDADAIISLRRFRKNFATERDTGSSTFKVGGISFRNRRIIRRR